ncbi:MAG TPA: hypothetical protein ENH70_09340 [Desulfobacteraceae bacterium]|nr:MAG: hypothetical protein DRG82_07450 [Deltaproteobacteria bacterium]HDZ24724.1 hypothetical protein [Desulfobacteraceae bacterium]
MVSEGDLVLVYYQDQPAVYARIEYIDPDIKKDWYQVTLQLLTIPSQTVTWILRASYIDGAPFTMGGKAMHLEEVKRITRQEKNKEEKPSKKTQGHGGKVIPFKKN